MTRHQSNGAMRSVACGRFALKQPHTKSNCGLECHEGSLMEDSPSALRLIHGVGCAI